MSDVQKISETIGSDSVRYELRTSSRKGTQTLAVALARELRPGMVIGLNGPLGAGKTELVRGLVMALGGGDVVSSPTFVLETVYDVAPQFETAIQSVRHWDLYRLTTGNAPPELYDAPELADAVTLVEWSERCAALEDLLCLRIMLAFGDPDAGSEELRTILIESRSTGDFPGADFRLPLT